MLNVMYNVQENLTHLVFLLLARKTHLAERPNLMVFRASSL